MRYFYRFAAVLVLLTFAGAYSAFAQCGGPADIGNVLAWFRADSNVTMASNNSNVLVWRDLSGNGFDAYAPSTTDSQPTRVTSCVMNNKPVINFANSTAPGKQMFKGHDSLPISHSSFTVFIVAMGNAQSASRYTGGLLKCGTITNGLWLYRRLTDQSFVFLNNYNTDANAYISSPTMPNAGFAFNVWSVRKTYGVKGEIFEDGALQVSSTYSKLVGPFTNAQFFIGNTQNIAGFDNFNGQIAEIIIFNRALSDSEMLCVNTYLHNRYVPPVNLGPDINESYRLCADTLRPSNCYSTYQWSTGSTASFIRVTQSGTYSLTATDVFGRTSADTINVAIPRVVLNTAVNLTICQGTPLTMSPQM
ncbi:MAG TPA: LamG-like jellyroll fold domain-containing protein, partial [Chitinophagales bacterium]|nr:LamG-like jellyroll fold domain-containing protein [Chitinophagales bacterium]